METKNISITTTVNASPVKVWDHWNTPEHIMQWNFASPDWHCPKAENDLKVGGKLTSRMEAKDGSFGFDFEGIYNEITPYEKISYTLLDGRQVITIFEEIDDKTKITTTFEADSQNPIEMQRDGWQAIINNFKLYTEG
ncbi:SRPBCC family protein [Galbibacter mesophilus]|uniref:SRPBCC family protein n=1 Tax=Galbibacter mesophilus TaxID=379069 RepID=UPI00191EB2BE|nr:SRPBCC family protein [Galbibacter mesophilus]MCM5663057.1 SRPBCC family protein [Galbibacter mesophilus]